MKKEQAKELIEEIRFLRNEVKELKDRFPYPYYVYPYNYPYIQWQYTTWDSGTNGVTISGDGISVNGNSCTKWDDNATFTIN
jgi:hypothetical protein